MPRPLDLEQKIDFLNKSGSHLMLFDQFYSPVGGGCDEPYLACCNSWLEAAKALTPEIAAYSKARLGMPPAGASLLETNVDKMASIIDEIAAEVAKD
jgi:hypothetical protein